MTGAVWIDYVNWRGVREGRVIEPISITWGQNEWHKEPQWLLKAYDRKREGFREFAMSGIKEWRKHGG